MCPRFVGEANNDVYQNIKNSFYYIDGTENEIAQNGILQFFREQFPNNDSSNYDSDSAFCFLADTLSDEDESLYASIIANGNVDAGEAVRSVSKMLKCFLKHCDSLTIVVEYMHIDATYRDSYYCCYSSHFFNYSRFSRRFNFFIGEVTDKDFISIHGASFKGIGNSTFDIDNESPESHGLNDKFIGSCVINPLGSGIVGRTIINPKYLIDSPCLIRLSKFETTVKGHRFITRAFPSMEQDQETMRCTEVTLLNLISYFANEYSGYAPCMPSDILQLEEEFSEERVLPARGIPYVTLSKILARLGFTPRLYDIAELERPYISARIRFKQILHWYVTSGIPVAVDVGPCDTEGGIGDGHSVVCVGYETIPRRIKDSLLSYFAGNNPTTLDDKTQQIINRALDVAYKFSRTTKNGLKSCTVFGSADFFDNYVTIDDNRLPYSVCPYDALTKYPDMENQCYAVPLHPRMALDALDAYDCFLYLLGNEKLGIMNVSDNAIDGDNRVIFRMFLASSRSFKRFRCRYSSPFISSVYQDLPLPHFIWVAELFHPEGYFTEDGKQTAFAEIVLDATEPAFDNIEQLIILMHYPKFLRIKMPGEMGAPEVEVMRPGNQGTWSDENDIIRAFTNNLLLVSPFESKQ